MTFQTVKLRLYGVLFLVAIIALIALSIAAYQKKFTPTVVVTLTTDFTGNQLQPQSDVKVRGIEVGEVRSIKATSTGASVKLALDPSKVDLIPVNVVAQLLPKTLFGEQYVALILPASSTGTIAAGNVIKQDTTYKAAQIQDLLRNTQPILNALNPAELNATLTALATALRGRGDQIGKSLVDLDTYLKQLNPSVPQLATDLVNLGKVASTYDAALPDILGTLDNLKTTSATVSAKSAALANFLSVGTSTSDALTTFFKADGNQIIQVAASSQPVLNVLAKYAPVYVCALAATTTLDTRAQQAFAGGVVKVTLSTTQAMGKYVAGEQPQTVVGSPNCNGLPNSVRTNGGLAADGAAQQGGTGSGALTKPFPGGFLGPASAQEEQLIKTVVSGDYDSDPTKVPDIAAIIGGPILRGSTVEVTGK